MSTSMMRPVTLDDTVAMRRAVTYPDAFSTVVGWSRRTSRAVAVRTSAGRSVSRSHHPAAATAPTTTKTATVVSAGLRCFSSPRSIFNRARSSLSGMGRF